MSRIHKFKDSLAIGKAAEEVFIAKYGDKLEQLDGRKGDFKAKKDGAIIELKSDSYDPAKTANFFMETISYGEKVGGPWQSKAHGAKYYVYQFVKTGDMYVFEVEALVAELERIGSKLRSVNVRNSGHTTQGLLVPRTLLLHLNLKLEDIL